MNLSRSFLVVVLLVLASVTMNVTAVEIIAHRGASADAPENTLSSFRFAWEQRADAIELDLWLSKDGKIIVFHDGETKRFEKNSRRISTLTLAEAQQVDVGSWKGAAFRRERIPDLEDVLATIPKGRRAVLEIKCGPEILPELQKVLRTVGCSPKEVAIISFNFEALKQSKRLLPEIEHYFLHGYSKDPTSGRHPDLGTLLQQCKAEHIDGLDLHFDWPIDQAFVTEVRAAGLRLLVWTVDDPSIALRLVQAGVEGITTNRPKWLRDRLTEAASISRP